MAYLTTPEDEGNRLNHLVESGKAFGNADQDARVGFVSYSGLDGIGWDWMGWSLCKICAVRGEDDAKDRMNSSGDREGPDRRAERGETVSDT